MSTTTAPPPTAERLAVLAHTVEVAAFGPDGVFDPSWLSGAAGELIEFCHGLLGMASCARLDSADTVGELLGSVR